MIIHNLANHYEIARRYGHGQGLVSLDFSSLSRTWCPIIQYFLLLMILRTCGVQWQTSNGILLTGTYSRKSVALLSVRTWRNNSWWKASNGPREFDDH